MSGWTSLRRMARPMVFRGRLALRAVERVLRPPVPWNGAHHPVFERFPPWSGEADGRFAHDFLGVKTDARFRPQLRADPPGPVAPAWPPPHAGYFEWVFVLESALAAADEPAFTMVELGAGYGPWLVAAHAALQRLRSNARPRLIGVEMVPHHFDWLHEHFRNNGIDPARHTLIRAATSDRAGEGHFVPETDPGWDFGQTLRDTAAGPIRTGPQPVPVETVTLSSLLAGVDRVDLLHIDIQGHEERVLREAIDSVERKVRRVIVATHSRRIHSGLRTLFAGRAFDRVYDYRCKKRERTDFGDIQFLDGLLGWVRRG